MISFIAFIGDNATAEDWRNALIFGGGFACFISYRAGQGIQRNRDAGRKWWQ